MKNFIDFKCLLKTGDYGRVVRGDFGRRYLVYESSRAFERKVYVESRIVELDEIDMNLRGLVKDCHVMCHRAGHEDQVIIPILNKIKLHSLNLLLINWHVLFLF